MPWSLRDLLQADEPAVEADDLVAVRVALFLVLRQQIGVGDVLPPGGEQFLGGEVAGVQQQVVVGGVLFGVFAERAGEVLDVQGR
jgi:hypothetical protein